jgi:hypothetical protein
MKRFLICLAALAAVLAFGALPVFAQHGGHGGGIGMGAAGGHGQGMDNSGGRRPTSAPNMGDQTSRSMAKTPDQILTQNTKLSQSLANLLPPGTNLADASRGFKNLGQFVAAVHVSHNLDIPFAVLKSKMVSGANLGQAIGDLKPDVNAKEEAKKANKQAKETLRNADS